MSDEEREERVREEAEAAYYYQILHPKCICEGGIFPCDHPNLDAVNPT